MAGAHREAIQIEMEEALLNHREAARMRQTKSAESKRYASALQERRKLKRQEEEHEQLAVERRRQVLQQEKVRTKWMIDAAFEEAVRRRHVQPPAKPGDEFPPPKLSLPETIDSGVQVSPIVTSDDGK